MIIRDRVGLPPRSPEGYLEGVDLNPFNTAVLEDFIQLAGIETPEWTLLFRVFGQELLIPKIGFRKDKQMSRS